METSKRNIIDVDNRVNNLNKILNAGKFVLVTDYIFDNSESDYKNNIRIDDFIDSANKQGFKYYIANKNRNLDELINIK